MNSEKIKRPVCRFCGMPATDSLIVGRLLLEVCPVHLERSKEKTEVAINEKEERRAD